ncbi:uncharacterized protein ACHE_80106S [Aspergillus chevalieri]|uniref:Uncharacterized protein n=1 Tax=Aspergillus chevalieri TaxID=182096 RepID=A0A7R7VWU8_ASPCH|nr:uncharacterized protein ACHE_80106S [Aspergillus chevalieri]BCR92206.1 hypothetical protein ACHE_80106S [Aspergillus chevalieri]
MALLSSNKWYKGYLQKVANGSLELPAYDLNPDGTIKIYYGEVFCRVEDCSRAQARFS